ncbi:iron-containing alcohol dehydrogenase [Eisenbergiella sp.]
MSAFVYDIPTKVYFGENQLEHLGKELAVYGSRVLICYGGGSIKKNGLFDRVTAEIKKAGLTWFELSGIEPNPRVASVNQGAQICKKEGIDVILAVGGGSVIDCAKFTAAAAFYDGDAWDIMTMKYQPTKALPILDISTLSATGSDMDAGGVISNPDTKDKIGFSIPGVLQPKVSFLDPTLTYSVSEYQTACGSADILSHVIESYFVPQNGSMYMLDKVKEGLMKTVIKYAPVALEEPNNYEARANLQWAASWAINGFTGVLQNCAWSCHPMEHELSAIYDITHGLGLAILTPRWMKYILDETTVERFYEYGVNVFGVDASLPQMEAAEKSIEMTKDFLYGTLGLKSTFGEIGIDDTNFSIMAKKACQGAVLPGFKPLKQEDIEKIFAMCL